MIFSSCRHPETAKRPNFSDIMQRFSLPDTKLLKWSEEDKATDPEAATLGADLDAGQELYKDLQERYIPKADNNDWAASNATKHSGTMSSPTTTGVQQRESVNAATVAAPPTPKANVLPASATMASGAHSYEDPSFLTFFQEDIDKLKDLAGTAASDAEKQEMIAITTAGGGTIGPHSYEDPKLVEALTEGSVNVSNTLSTND